ncbi:MAG: cysteine--tRNA ligase [Holosporaceae bacterium]|jgi:cysteinyl-tRNA synthetase|nr:cysteine--tRNA ligase [Holosporaceae bacterium]
MKKLQIHNSLSGKIKDFIPLDDKNIRIYACGPTVYSSPHIGNARPLVIFDVLFRLLKTMYPTVIYVRNITDVDDKINAGAKEKNISIKELTDEVIKEFHQNIELINVLPVTHEPRATAHIKEMLEIISTLVAREFAYVADNHVLFRVRKMSNYGMLSKRNLDDMIAGSRIEIAPYKEDPLDFVLWKPAEIGSPSWDSPFGKGRPGWHIECSAMSKKYLGNKFDIHAGGQDLIFPHHENEIAQNFGICDCVPANYWMHNGMLLVNGQKMSKSLGNIISLKDILQRYDGEIIRYVLLSSHYQKTLNWTDEAVSQAKRALNRLYGALELSTESTVDENDDSNISEALLGNLNTPLALRRLHEIADQIYKSSDQTKINVLSERLKNSANLLGLLNKESKSWFKQHDQRISSEKIEQLLAKRQKAKADKNFALADKIRKELLSDNILVEDTKNGSTWKILR